MTVLILNLFFLYSLKINWSRGTIIALLTPAVRALSLHPSEFKKNISWRKVLFSSDQPEPTSGLEETSKLPHKQHLTRLLREIGAFSRLITWFVPKWLKNSHPGVFTSDPTGRCPAFRSSQRIHLISSDGFHLSPAGDRVRFWQFFPIQLCLYLLLSESKFSIVFL